MKYKFLKLVVIISFVPLFTACGNTVKALEDQIEKFGYILFRTPVELSGTGTMVGGSPKSLSFVAGPQTCFPDPTQEGALPLRHVDNANLPSLNQSVSFEGNLKLEIIKFLGNGNGLFKVKSGFDTVSALEIEFGDAKVEYIDSVVLEDFYKEQMSESCKNFLDKVGFIIQALRVDTMKFKFKRSSGGYIDFSIDNIQEILDIAANVNWRIEQNTTLIITSPKYVGYQLGNLVRSTNGHSLYRASRTRGNKFIFENIGIFDKAFPGNDSDRRFATKSSIRILPEPQVEILDEQLIKQFSRYRKLKQGN